MHMLAVVGALTKAKHSSLTDLLLLRTAVRCMLHTALHAEELEMLQVTRPAS